MRSLTGNLQYVRAGGGLHTHARPLNANIEGKACLLPAACCQSPPWAVLCAQKELWGGVVPVPLGCARCTPGWVLAIRDEGLVDAPRRPGWLRQLGPPGRGAGRAPGWRGGHSPSRPPGPTQHCRASVQRGLHPAERPCICTTAAAARGVERPPTP